MANYNKNVTLVQGTSALKLQGESNGNVVRLNESAFRAFPRIQEESYEEIGYRTYARQSARQAADLLENGTSAGVQMNSLTRPQAFALGCTVVATLLAMIF